MINRLTVFLALVMLQGPALADDLTEAFAALERGERESALALFEADADNPTAQLQLAMLYMGSDPDTAEDWIEKALESQPDNAQVYFVRGNIMGAQAQQASVFSAMGYAKKCKTSYERAVELEPENPEYMWGLMQFYINAPAIAGGDMETAAELVERISQVDEKAGLLARLDYHGAREENDQVEATLKAGKAAYPDSAEFYFRTGIYEMQDENFSAAFTEFTTASEMVSTDEDSEIARYNAMYQIGRTALFSEQKIPEGIAALNRFIEEAPASESLPDKNWAHFRLAGLYELADRRQDAKVIYASLEGTSDKDLRKQVRKKLKKL